MSNLVEIIQKYSIKNDEQINKICAPLVDYLNIPVFTYSFVEADGSFGYLTNAFEFSEYYFLNKHHMDNPYFSHPALFRSGQTSCSSGFDKKSQNALKTKFNAGHFILDLQSNGSRMEHFIFAEINQGKNEPYQFLRNIDLLKKFELHFKREARNLIGQMKAEKYNIRKIRGETLFENPDNVSLRKNQPNIISFLKETSGLNPNQISELSAFKDVKFTNKEKEILQEILMGNYASEAAKNLFLSNRTVEHHIERIKEKLDCKTKTDLLKKVRSLESIGYLF